MSSLHHINLLDTFHSCVIIFTTLFICTINLSYKVLYTCLYTQYVQSYACINYFFTEPSAPRMLIVNAITYTTVTLSWMPPMMPNGILIQYDLEYTEEGNTLFSRIFLSFSQRSHTITELTPGTTYQFRVAAVTIVGRGPYATTIDRTTLSKFFIIDCF